MKLKINGMVCESCEKIITRSLEDVDGINNVKASYVDGSASIDYDPKKTSKEDIIAIIEKKGYTCAEPKKLSNHQKLNLTLGWIFGVLGIIVMGYYLFHFAESIQLPAITQNMSYGLLFLVGLLTGFHCVSMCGGFVVSYTTEATKNNVKPYQSHFLYGLGKTVSYTIVGAIFGLLGSIIAFTPAMRGVAGILAGLFLIIFGLKMLNIFPILRKFSLPKPKFLNKYFGKSHSPLFIGLLNGLMIACGPLQAIYIMAAGTGSMIEGAKLLFVFALGTLPVMLSFGFLTSFISSKATQKILKASGVIVIILGMIMVNRGLALTGTGYDSTTLLTSLSANNDKISGDAIAINNGYQEIRMEVTRYGWEPDKFVLKKDVPVKWIIEGKEITGCNNAIQVPKYNLKFDIKPGEQVIEFTPTEEGVISWSCWMGMIPGTFIVKDDINVNDQAAVAEEIAKAPTQAAGSCGGSCGSPSCGGGTPSGCGCGGK